MKLPFTEEFLWGIYDLIEGMQDIHGSFSVPSLKDVVYPEMAQLRKIYKKRKSREEFTKFVSYLKNRGYLKIKKTVSGQAVLLTPKGWRKVLIVSLKKQKSKLKKRQDKKWIMVFFDIPEYKKGERNWLRRNLQYLGFQMWQKSIWVSPYDVLDDVEELINSFNIKEYIQVLLVEEITK